MTIWENIKKQLNTLIDLPLDIAQKQELKKKALLAHSGAMGASVSYPQPSVSTQSHLSKISKVRSIKEPAGKKYSSDAFPGSFYSHGLEKIYALETIDPKSVKPLTLDPKIDLPDPAALHPQVSVNSPAQFEFDFGACWRNWITPCCLMEPLQVLGLAPQAEKVLINQGIKTLGDLIQADNLNLRQIKGLGQGHIDELQHKTKSYFGFQNSKCTHLVDLGAWLRGIVANLEPKKAFVLLEKYGLSQALQIPAYLNIEIKRLTESGKEKIAADALLFIKQTMKEHILKRWEEITFAFFIPWLNKRQNIDLFEDLLERFECICIQTGWAQAMEVFLRDIFDVPFAFEAILPKIMDQSFVSEKQDVEYFCTIYSMAEAYFYSPRVSYPLVDLVYYIQRELAKKWIASNPLTIEKALLCNPSFLAYQNQDGIQVIAQALRF